MAEFGRDLAPARLKRPESVLVVVHSRDGQVLLLQRRNPHTFWQSVTGSLYWEELPDDAARRELWEETGLEGQPQATGVVNRYPIVPPWKARYAPHERENLERVYTFQIPGPVQVRLHPREHVAFVWLTRDDAAQRVSSPTNRAAIKALP